MGLRKFFRVFGSSMVSKSHNPIFSVLLWRSNRIELLTFKHGISISCSLKSSHSLHNIIWSAFIVSSRWLRRSGGIFPDNAGTGQEPLWQQKGNCQFYPINLRRPRAPRKGKRIWAPLGGICWIKRMGVSSAVEQGESSKTIEKITLGEIIELQCWTKWREKKTPEKITKGKLN